MAEITIPSQKVLVPDFDPTAILSRITTLEAEVDKLKAAQPVVSPAASQAKPFKNDTWSYKKLADSAAIDLNSPAIVNDLALQAKDKLSGGTSTYYPGLPFAEWSVPIYHVTADIPKKKLVYSTGKETMFRVPDGVLAALGGDKHCAIFDWIEKRFIDLWAFDPVTLVAKHGGLIENFPASDGTFPYPMGARACGIAANIGVISIDSIEKGLHEGVVALCTSRTNKSPKWPANRVDSYAYDGPLVRMGHIFRLPAGFVPDVAWPSGLKTIANAARDYGMVVIDTTNGSNVNMAYIEDPRPRGKTASEINTKYFGGIASWKLGQMFPWAKLQALA